VSQTDIHSVFPDIRLRIADVAKRETTSPTTRTGLDHCRRKPRPPAVGRFPGMRTTEDGWVLRPSGRGLRVCAEGVGRRTGRQRAGGRRNGLRGRMCVWFS